MDELGRLVAKALRMKGAPPSEDFDFRGTVEWDSLGHMELVAAIEERWNVTLTSEEIIGMRTMAGIRKMLRAHGVKGGK